MSFDDAFTFISISVAVFGVLIFLILIGIQASKSKKIHKNDPPKKNIQNDLDYEFTTTEITATVVDMTCNTKVLGQKNVKSVEEFFVYFKTENNETIKMKVLKEMYDGFEIGQIGKLQLVDGDFFGFEIFKLQR